MLRRGNHADGPRRPHRTIHETRANAERVICHALRVGTADGVRSAFDRKRLRQLMLEFDVETERVLFDLTNGIGRKQTAQFIGRERVHMRRIAEAFDRIETKTLRGRNTEVDNDNASTRPADTKHLAQRRCRIGKVMKRVASDDDREGLVLVRQR